MRTESENHRTFKEKRIGIMGGTFNPVHLGHLFIAETASEAFDLEEVIFIPTGMPPHKDGNKVLDGAHRLKMLSLAIESNDMFTISDMEIKREKTTYTIDTIGELEEIYPDGTSFYFILGTDAFMDIETWREYKTLLRKIHFIVMTRDPKFTDHLLDNKIAFVKDNYDGSVYKMGIPLLDISSTDLRNRLEEGRSIRYLVPDGVVKYIFDNNLYKK